MTTPGPGCARRSRRRSAGRTYRERRRRRSRRASARSCGSPDRWPFDDRSATVRRSPTRCPRWPSRRCSTISATASRTSPTLGGTLGSDGAARPSPGTRSTAGGRGIPARKLGIERLPIGPADVQPVLPSEGPHRGQCHVPTVNRGRCPDAGRPGPGQRMERRTSRRPPAGWRCFRALIRKSCPDRGANTGRPHHPFGRHVSAQSCYVISSGPRQRGCAGPRPAGPHPEPQAQSDPRPRPARRAGPGAGARPPPGPGAPAKSPRIPRRRPTRRASCCRSGRRPRQTRPEASFRRSAADGPAASVPPRDPPASAWCRS